MNLQYLSAIVTTTVVTYSVVVANYLIIVMLNAHRLRYVLLVL